MEWKLSRTWNVARVARCLSCACRKNAAGEAPLADISLPWKIVSARAMDRCERPARRKIGPPLPQRRGESRTRAGAVCDFNAASGATISSRAMRINRAGEIIIRGRIVDPGTPAFPRRHGRGRWTQGDLFFLLPLPPPPSPHPPPSPRWRLSRKVAAAAAAPTT